MVPISLSSPLKLFLFFVALSLAFPIASAFSPTDRIFNDTVFYSSGSGSTIYLGNSSSNFGQNLNVTNESAKFYQLLNEGRFLNINATTTARAEFFNLSQAFPYYSNGTVPCGNISLCNGALNATFSLSQAFYLLQAYNITENRTRLYDPISFTKSQSGLDTFYTFNDTLNGSLSGIVFYPINASCPISITFTLNTTAMVTPGYSCNGTNLTSVSLDGITQGTNVLHISLNPITESPVVPGQGSIWNENITEGNVNDQPREFFINLSYEEQQFYNVPFRLKILAYYDNKTVMDVSQIKTEVASLAAYKDGLIMRNVVGEYEKGYTFYTASNDSALIRVTAFQGNRTISKTAYVVFEAPNAWDKFKGEAKTTANALFLNAFNFVKSHRKQSIVVMIIGGILLVGLVIGIFYKGKPKANS